MGLDQAILNALGEVNRSMGGLVNQRASIARSLQGVQPVPYDTTFMPYELDLTSAHADESVLPPMTGPLVKLVLPAK